MSINPELWHACAGPRVSLPPVGSLVVYFPQGHLEQVAASTQKELDGQFPNYPNLPSQLICQLHNVVLHADIETDEVFAQMTLQPINAQGKEAFLSPPDLSPYNRQPNDFFCKTLTASDTSTHGGFSVPRRSANKVFPPLDYSKEPPAQELHAKDLHGQLWTFRHIFRGQPKRHLLTTGWSVFISTKRLVAGDSVVFIRDEKEQLLIGIRRANRQQTAMPSSVLSTDSMHIGVLAAAAHAYTTSTRFLVFYNPRTSPSEFVVPLAKYKKAIYGMQLSVGTRFRMAFETEELTLRRYMGTITGMSDLDPIRWPSSPWCNSEVGWDESSSGERPRRVSAWDIEPISTTPFHICPPQLMPLRPKRTWLYGSLGDEVDLDGTTKRGFTLLRGESSRREVEAYPLQSLSPAMPVQSESHMRHVVTTASVALPNFRVDDASDQHSQFRFPNPNPALASLSTAYFPDLDDGDLAQISRNAFSLQSVLSRPHKVDEMAWSHQNLPTLSSMQMPQPAHTNSSAPTMSTTTTSMMPFSIHPPELQGYGGITDSSVVSSLVDPKSYSVGDDINAQMSNAVSLPSLLPSPSQSFQSLPASISSSIASDASMNSGFSVSGGIDDALLPPIRTSGGWPSMPTPLRTFTKVQKFGSIGRSLDVSRFMNYVELRRELARLFNLQGQLDDPHSGWQLVFVDNEGDVLLIGDDPWEEFVSCVRIIRILSPSEVLQMSQEGMELLKAIPSTTCDDEPHVWKDNTWGLAQ